MKINIKKLHPKAQIPVRSTEHAAGFDITATEILDSSLDTIRYGTGLAFEIPVGYVGLLAPRSSICKTTLRLSNSIGILDPDYRGEVTFVFDRVGFEPMPEYKAGERIGQLIVVKSLDFEFVEQEQLSQTGRGAGGYGSTGK